MRLREWIRGIGLGGFAFGTFLAWLGGMLLLTACGGGYCSSWPQFYPPGIFVTCAGVAILLGGARLLSTHQGDYADATRAASIENLGLGLIASGAVALGTGLWFESAALSPGLSTGGRLDVTVYLLPIGPLCLGTGLLLGGLLYLALQPGPVQSLHPGSPRAPERSPADFQAARKKRLAVIVIADIAVVAGVGGYLVAIIPPIPIWNANCPSYHPTVTFTAYPNGPVQEVLVAGIQPAVESTATCSSLNISLNGTYATPVAFGGAWTFSFGGNAPPATGVFVVTWTDLGGSGYPVQGDTFTIAHAGGLPAGTYGFYFLWADGATYAWVTFQR